MGSISPGADVEETLADRAARVSVCGSSPYTLRRWISAPVIPFQPARRRHLFRRIHPGAARADVRAIMAACADARFRTVLMLCSGWRIRIIRLRHLGFLANPCGTRHLTAIPAALAAPGAIAESGRIPRPSLAFPVRSAAAGAQI
jgi:hypothetical protein